MRNHEKREERQSVDKKWKIVFILYIVLLLIFVVFKFDGSVNSVITRMNMISVNRREGCWNFNLIPLKSVSHYIRHIDSAHGYINILGNLVPFFPMGILLPVNFFKSKSSFKTMITSFLMILSIETIQFITMTGYFDIDDIGLNLTGSLIGYCLFLIAIKHFHCQEKRSL